MSVAKMDSETVRAEWRKWVEAVGEGKADVVLVVEGKETAALISFQDYLALSDELIRLRTDRKDPLEELAISSSLDYLVWEERMDDDDDGDSGGGDDGGDGE